MGVGGVCVCINVCVKAARLHTDIFSGTCWKPRLALIKCGSAVNPPPPPLAALPRPDVCFFQDSVFWGGWGLVCVCGGGGWLFSNEAFLSNQTLPGPAAQVRRAGCPGNADLSEYALSLRDPAGDEQAVPVPVPPVRPPLRPAFVFHRCPPFSSSFLLFLCTTSPSLHLCLPSLDEGRVLPPSSPHVLLSSSPV